MRLLVIGFPEGFHEVSVAFLGIVLGSKQHKKMGLSRTLA